MNFALALSGFLPAVLLMVYVERYDTRRPEPRHLLRKVAMFGGLATLPCIAAQYSLERLFNPGGWQGALFTSYLSAAVTEESAKALCLYLVVWRHPAFDERFDGIVYGTRAGLGFALVENIGYLMGSHSLSGFFGIFVLRAVLAVPGHAIYAGFMGHWAAKKRFDGVGPGLAGGLLIAIALHGTYDAALFILPHLPKHLALLALPLVATPLGIVVFGYRRLKKHALEDLALDELTHAHDTRPRLPLGVGFVLR